MSVTLCLTLTLALPLALTLTPTQTQTRNCTSPDLSYRNITPLRRPCCRPSRPVVSSLSCHAPTGLLTAPIGPALTGLAASTAASGPTAAAAPAAVAAIASAGQAFTACSSPTLYQLPNGTCALQCIRRGHVMILATNQILQSRLTHDGRQVLRWRIAWWHIS